MLKFKTWSDNSIIRGPDYVRVNRRTDDLIASQILGICENGAGKTKTIYQANLNSTTAKYYLVNLMKNGLVTEISFGSRIIYRTTFKGSDLRDKHMRLQRELADLQKIMCYVAE
jgi:predicted transcriptional regulator